MNKNLKKQIAERKKLKNDPRYIKVLESFVYAKLLDSNVVSAKNNYISLDDVLFAGLVEPRIFELLPAVLIKKPNLIRQKNNPPEDLVQVIKNIKRKKSAEPFRGIPAEKYLYWLDKVGRKGKTPSIRKTFRFDDRMLNILEKCKEKFGKNESAIIRIGLESLLSARVVPHQSDANLII